MIVLDTNVVSELIRLKPSMQVIQWIASQPSFLLCTTAITQAEILYGVQILAKGKRRDALEEALRAIFEEDFQDRVLGFDSSCAPFFAGIAAARKSLGRPISQFDAQIAAIASRNKAALATRNIADFAGCGLKLINPWEPIQ
jgi:predicted nucleic acid-binding protein